MPLLDVPALVERSEMLLLAVPDDQLAPLAAGIAATGMVPGGQLVAHTSGRYGTDVLAPLAAAGSATLALHPAMTFTGTRTDLARLIGCPMGITAAPELLPVAAALVVELGGDSVVIAEGDRPLYHAALAHSANHLTVLVDQAREALSRLGIEDPARTCARCSKAALEESLRRGAKALTGPVVRGDAGTVSAHLEALGDLDVTGAPGERGDIADTYRALALAALSRADSGGRSEDPGAAAGAAAEGGRRMTQDHPGTGPARHHETGHHEDRAAQAPRRDAGHGRRGARHGSLHAGHLALVERARELADHVILTDFVNPLQFGPGEDYEAYPRDLDADLALVDGLVDVVFAPAVQEMYPVLPPTVSVTAGHAGTILEGAARPGHFDGVVTVVTKLLQLTSPHLSVFGRKDAQQLAIIQRLVADLDLPVRIEPVEIQRANPRAGPLEPQRTSAPRARAGAGLSRTLGGRAAPPPSAAGIRDALAAAVARAEIAEDYAHAWTGDPAPDRPGAPRRGAADPRRGRRGHRLLDAAVGSGDSP